MAQRYSRLVMIVGADVPGVNEGLTQFRKLILLTVEAISVQCYVELRGDDVTNQNGEDSNNIRKNNQQALILVRYEYNGNWQYKEQHQGNNEYQESHNTIQICEG